MTWEIFKIHRGTDEIDLLDEDGWWLLDWEPAVLQLEDGGIWADNKSTGGRQPAFGVFGNAVETLVMGLSGPSKAAVDAQIGTMLDTMAASFFYWVPGSKVRDIAYLEVKESEWSASRYAALCDGGFPNLPEIQRGNYETGVIVNGRSKPVGISTMELTLEHKGWSDQIPRLGTCVETSSLFDWNYSARVNSVFTTTTRGISAALYKSNGDLYLAEIEAAGQPRGKIWKSTDDGQSWSENLSASPMMARVYKFLELANGDILAGGDSSIGGSILRSTNDGGSWAETYTGARVIDMVQLSNGDVIAVGYFGIWRSTDNGQNWTQVYALDIYTMGPSIDSVMQAPDGRVLATTHSADYVVLNSIDNGQNWSVLSHIPVVGSSLAPTTYLITIGTTIYAINESVYKSNDNAVTWTQVSSGQIRRLSPTVVGTTIYALQGLSSGASIVVSFDLGETWRSVASKTGGAAYYYMMVYNSNSQAIMSAIDDDHFYELLPGTIIQLGQEATCDNVIMVGNKTHQSNLTDIVVSDGGVLTTIYPNAALPVAFLPNPVAANDAVYFGTNINVSDSGPFDGLVFQIETPVNTQPTMVWEYPIGPSTWTTLSTRDETENFQVTGAGMVSWIRPSDWVTITFNGIEGWWIRARVSAVTGTITPPTQGVSRIFAINRAKVSIADDQIISGMAAVARIKMTNRSDRDGPLGSGPYLFANRVVVGLHTLIDSDQFVAYLNLANEQNPIGISANLGEHMTYVDLVRAPAGQAMLYTPLALESMATRGTVILGPTVAQSFYGTFHVYLRGKRTGGVETDISVRLEVVSGSGGIAFQSIQRRFKSELDFEVLDMGEITVPVGGGFASDELGDVTEIRVQANAASSDATATFYDVIMIHVDEWAGNFVDTANNGLSDIGRSGETAKLLDIDSISNPREEIEAKVRVLSDSLITSRYNVASVGPAMLQRNSAQDLWFLAMQASAVGADYVWLAPPEIVHSVQVFYSSRYRTILS